MAQEGVGSSWWREMLKRFRAVARGIQDRGGLTPLTLVEDLKLPEGRKRGSWKKSLGNLAASRSSVNNAGATARGGLPRAH